MYTLTVLGQRLRIVSLQCLSSKTSEPVLVPRRGQARTFHGHFQSQAQWCRCYRIQHCVYVCVYVISFKKLFYPRLQIEGIIFKWNSACMYTRKMQVHFSSHDPTARRRRDGRLIRLTEICEKVTSTFKQFVFKCELAWNYKKEQIGQKQSH